MQLQKLSGMKHSWEYPDLSYHTHIPLVPVALAREVNIQDICADRIGRDDALPKIMDFLVLYLLDGRGSMLSQLNPKRSGML